MSHTRLLLPLLLLLPVPALAQTRTQAPATAASSARAQPAPNALGAFERDVLSLLALRDGADRLAGAAVLARAVPDLPPVLSYRSFLARAQAAPGAGAPVWWVTLGDCGTPGPQPQDCISDAALARLQRLAPDNAAVWLLAYDRARQRGDAAAARSALARAAQCREFSTYYGVLLHAVLDATRTLPMPATLVQQLGGPRGNAYAATYLLAAGNVMYLPTLALAPLYETCKDPGHDATLRAQCVRIAHLLAWGDTVFARAAGLDLQEHLATDAAARARYAAERHALAWQTQQFARLVLHARSDEKLAARLVQLVLAGGTENTIQIALLREAGIASEPPGDWQG